MYEIGGVERPPAHAQKAAIQTQAELHLVAPAGLDRGDLRWAHVEELLDLEFPRAMVESFRFPEIPAANLA